MEEKAPNRSTDYSKAVAPLLTVWALPLVLGNSQPDEP